MNKYIAVLVALIVFGGCAHTGKSGSTAVDTSPVDIQRVDRFSLMKRSVQVFFFEPSIHIQKRFPNHEQVDEAVRLEQWMDYLHNNILYVFAVLDEEGKYTDYYVLRGNPATQAARFYKVDILKKQSSGLIDRLIEGYDTAPAATVEAVPAGGVLFEHMAQFQTPAGRRYVGQGVKFNGKFFKVTRYAELREAIVAIIKDDL